MQVGRAKAIAGNVSLVQATEFEFNYFDKFDPVAGLDFFLRLLGY